MQIRFQQANSTFKRRKEKVVQIYKKRSFESSQKGLAMIKTVKEN